MKTRFYINYRQQRLLSSTTHVLACADREEADLYALLIQEDASIGEALLIDKEGAPRGTTRIK